MNHVWRKIDGIEYFMRDASSTKQLRKIFEDIKAKYPNTKLTFHRWLVDYGKVYFKRRVKNA